MAKILFFFTSSYPFGTGETFIENEIEYLTNAFEKVVIISNDISSKQTRKVTNNISLKKLSYELNNWNKIKSYLRIFNKIFWEEYKQVKVVYKKNVSLPIVNTMLQTLQKSRQWYSIINNLIKKESTQNDQVYLYSYWNNDIAFALANFKSKNPQIKAFSRMHGWDVYFEANEIDYLPYRRYLFTNLNKVFAISEKGRNYYQKILPNLGSKIQVSRLGVKENGINPTNKSDKLVLVTISNLIAIKNLGVLIDALGLLKIDFFWFHIGDGILKTELNIQAKKLIPNRYSFLGRISNNDVFSFLNSQPIDIFMNVSLSEGIPVSIMEAMSFGIPCIATDVGGTPEIVNNENGVLLAKKPTPNEVAEKVMLFSTLNDTEKLEKRKAAYKTWHKKYNADINYHNFTKTIYAL